MRDFLSTMTGCCVVSSMLIVSAVNAQAEQRTAPWDSVGCNAACRWWMNLGAKPAADIKPAMSGPSPAMSAKALVPDAALAAAMPPTSAATILKSLTSPDRTDRGGRGKRGPAISMLPPERPAYIPGQGFWTVRIAGSASVLPATLLTPP